MFGQKAAPKEDIAAMVRAEVAKQIATMHKDMRNSMERLQTLAGERGPRDGAQRAVMRGELADIGDVTMTASTLAADPTMDDYNKLLTDVQAVVALLERLRDTFTVR
jgi:hypothetical protein